MKRKTNGMYLLSSDIEKLNERYSILYKKIKTDTYLPPIAVNKECEVLLEKYNFEIDELNALRKVEYETQRAKVEARNQEETPWRRCWLWRLLLKPVTNRAQDIIEEEAAQNADERFTPKEKELVRRIFKLYDIDLKGLSLRKRKKLLKLYFNNKSLLEAALNVVDEVDSLSEADNAQHDAAHQSDGNTQKAATEQLEEIIKAADDTPPGEAFEEPEPPAAEQTSEAPTEQPPAEVQSNKRSRKNRKPKAQKQPQTKIASEMTSTPIEPSEATSEPPAGAELELKEVSTDVGAQLTLPIP